MASWAWFRCASLEEVSASLGWASSLPFARFYLLHVTSEAAGPPYWSPWHLWLWTAGRSRPVAMLLLLPIPADVIWNSVDPYFGVLTDMK